jgi:hypothetical protein
MKLVRRIENDQGLVKGNLGIQAALESLVEDQGHALGIEGEEDLGQETDTKEKGITDQEVVQGDSQ